LDSDKDGVPDIDDRCPDTPAGVKVDTRGCPVDTDNDGVADYLDKCPGTPARVQVDANGCPIDTDKDGVADYIDKCPDTPAGSKVDANGCVVVNEEAKKAFGDAMYGIQFETNSKLIKPASNPVLNNVVKVLTNNPQYTKVEIAGHADSVGSEDYNLNLSQQRADEVKKYLVNKGVSSARLNAIGYGETQPVADNATPEGRKQNRRVDFKVKN
jgi:outer membrane protein OmpA-like peptidoglycan-associated protein